MHLDDARPVVAAGPAFLVALAPLHPLAELAVDGAGLNLRFRSWPQGFRSRIILRSLLSSITLRLFFVMKLKDGVALPRIFPLAMAPRSPWSAPWSQCTPSRHGSPRPQGHTISTWFSKYPNNVCTVHDVLLRFSNQSGARARALYND